VSNDQVFAIIERETGQKVDDSTLLESLEVDSLEFLDLVLVISAEVGKEIPDEQLSQLKTVGDIVQALN
jgi:acyl carrier protein